MLSLLFLLSASKSYGYNTLTLSPGENYSVDIADSFLIYSNNDPSLSSISAMYLNDDGTNTTIPFTSLNSIQFFTAKSNFYLMTTSNVSRDFSYWLLPHSECQGISYSITADLSIQATVTMVKPSQTFCVFPQTNSIDYRASVILSNYSNNAFVEFKTMPDKVEAKTSKGNRVDFSIEKPFYLKFVGFNNAFLKATIGLSVQRQSIKSADCKFEPIPLSSGSELQFPIKADNVFNVEETICMSAAERRLKNTVIILFLVLFAFVVLMTLQCLHMINIYALCGVTKEKERFTDLRENPYIPTIENPNDNIELNEEQIE